MSSTLRPFQIILIGIFAALAVGGLILFAVYRGFGGESNPYGEAVEIWGILDGQAVSAVISEIHADDDDFQVVSYMEKDPRTFRTELANAIAEGRGPNAVIIPHDLLVSERGKLYPIPYDTLPLRDIKDTYVDGTEIFALKNGMYGFPLAVDPLVLYWNRSIFSSAGLATPPATWEQLVSQTVPAIAKVNQSQAYAVDRAAIAFGEYTNVQNAPEVMLMLLMQAGSRLVVEGEAGRYEALLNQSIGEIERPPLDAALDFYTQFANPARPIYTWNRSLPRDREAFLAERLAVYFGFASEHAALRAGNANLDFDAAPIPQGGSAPIKKDYGTFYTLALLRSSDNFEGAYRAVSRLSAAEQAQTIAERAGLAPVHRAALAKGASDPLRQTMYTAALIARGFLNPDPMGSRDIIRTMIEDVTSGRADVSRAAGDALERFNQLLFR